MADTSRSINGVEALSTLVELNNRIKVRANYEAVVAAFDHLDDDSTMATNINTNFAKITTDAGGQLGENASGLDDIQAKAKQIVQLFARRYAALRMRCSQSQEPGSLNNIEVTKDEVARAKEAARMLTKAFNVARVFGLTRLATPTARPMAKCTEKQATDDKHAAEIAELKAKIAKLEARITEMEAKSTETKAESTEPECEFPLLMDPDQEYMYTYQDIHGGGDAPESHLEGAEEYNLVSIEANDVVSIVVNVGSDTQENDDTIFLE